MVSNKRYEFLGSLMNEFAANTNLRRLIHAICWGGASSFALSTAASAADATGPAASGNNENDLTEITVTGIRASLQQSLDMKREADGIIDAISAEDIGKFPDAN